MVAAAGDGASGQTSESDVVNLISSWNPNLFLYLGDVYENGRAMEFDNWYGKPSTAGTYGQFYPISDPAIGNHEYVGSDISGYEWYWNNVPHYYSYDAGGWHFVSLDNISKFIGSSPSNANYKAETNWLNSDLNKNKLACTIVYYHEPMFNVGPEGTATNTAGIWQILAQHHVTIALNGHDHDYQRWVPLDASGNPSATGVTEFVSGPAGHGHQNQVNTDSRLAASDFTHYGALRLALGSAGASYQFITTSGTTVDSGSIPCEGTGATDTAASQPAEPHRDRGFPDPGAAVLGRLHRQRGRHLLRHLPGRQPARQLGTARRIPGPDRAAWHHLQLLRAWPRTRPGTRHSPATRRR